MARKKQKRKYPRWQAIFFKRLGLRLRAIRNERNFTLEKAEELGFKSWPHLQRIEAGDGNIRMETLLLLSKIYKTHPSDVLKGL